MKPGFQQHPVWGPAGKSRWKAKCQEKGLSYFERLFIPSITGPADYFPAFLVMNLRCLIT
jgi:hypothetical protein